MALCETVTNEYMNAKEAWLSCHMPCFARRQRDHAWVSDPAIVRSESPYPSTRSLCLGLQPSHLKISTSDLKKKRYTSRSHHQTSCSNCMSVIPSISSSTTPSASASAPACAFTPPLPFLTGDLFSFAAPFPLPFALALAAPFSFAGDSPSLSSPDPDSSSSIDSRETRGFLVGFLTTVARPFFVTLAFLVGLEVLGSEVASLEEARFLAVGGLVGEVGGSANGLVKVMACDC